MGPGSNLAGGRFGAMPIRRTSSRGLRLPGEIPGGHPTLVGLLFVVVVFGGGARQIHTGGERNANLPKRRGSHAASKPARDVSQRL